MKNMKNPLKIEIFLSLALIKLKKQSIIMVNGKKGIDKVKDNNVGLMALNMMDIGRIIKLMAREDLSMLMVMFMRVIG